MLLFWGIFLSFFLQNLIKSRFFEVGLWNRKFGDKMSRTSEICKKKQIQPFLSEIIKLLLKNWQSFKKSAIFWQKSKKIWNWAEDTPICLNFQFQSPRTKTAKFYLDFKKKTWKFYRKKGKKIKSLLLRVKIALFLFYFWKKTHFSAKHSIFWS